MPFYNNSSDYNDFSISFTSTPIYDFGVFAKGYSPRRYLMIIYVWPLPLSLG